MTCEVRYEVSGPQSGPVLVLSGSLGTDRSMWDPQIAPLSTWFRVLRYDLRGHGESPIPRAPYSIADLGEDLVALLDRLEIERASLCGVSIGGMTSMWVGAHAPERVERLAVCCTTAWFGPEASATFIERAATVREHGLEPLADAALERWFTPQFRESERDVVARMRRILVATPREGYAGCCEALGAMDLRPELSSISAPTLVVSAEDDPATPPEHGRAIAEGIGAAGFSLVPHAAHLASIERAELVTALILRFLHPEEDTG